MKLTQIDKAIQGLEQDRLVIDMAIQKLRAAQAAKPARVKKATKPHAVAEVGRG